MPLIRIDEGMAKAAVEQADRIGVLDYNTRRVAISNRRLIDFQEAGVTFRYKDRRRDGADSQRVPTPGIDELIRRASYSISSHVQSLPRAAMRDPVLHDELTSSPNENRLGLADHREKSPTRKRRGFVRASFRSRF